LLGLSFGLLAQGPSYVEKADNAFENEAFYEAIDLYKKAYAKEKKPDEKARLIFMIAESYAAILDFPQAEVWYSKAIKAKFSEPVVYYKLAYALQNQGMYKEALRRYKQYFQKVETDPLAQVDYDACQIAQSWVDNPTKFVVDPEVQINSPQFDFSPHYASENYMSLAFTSSREASEGAKIDNRSGENYQDIYITTRDEKGKWSEPVGIAKLINSKYNEGAACFSADFKTIYFTRCIESEDDRMGCDIFYTTKTEDGWTEEPIKMNLKPEGGDSITIGHPSLSKDGKLLLFASDMPGGYGGRDIWMVKRANAEGVWSSPVNLGSEINTPENELFPFIHTNGNL
jgi:peptidoglycan-associated lipoprotein